MSDLEKARTSAVSTEDLLARARALTAQNSSAPASAPQVQEESDEIDPHNFLDTRRQILTSRLIRAAVESLAPDFELSFAGNCEVAGLDEQTLETYLGWAATDVAWLFADRMASDGDDELAKTFLHVTGQPVLDVLGISRRPAGPAEVRRPCGR